MNPVRTVLRAGAAAAPGGLPPTGYGADMGWQADGNPGESTEEIALGLSEFDPAGWRRLEAWFAMTSSVPVSEFVAGFEERSRRRRDGLS